MIDDLNKKFTPENTAIPPDTVPSIGVTSFVEKSPSLSMSNLRFDPIGEPPAALKSIEIFLQTLACQVSLD